MTDGTRPVVVALNEQSDVPIDTSRWASLVEATLRDRAVEAGELNLLFVDEQEMTSLNRTHMNKDQPTDVLSFPLDGVRASTAESLIGDIVICPAHAAVNAPQHRGVDGHSGTLEDELALLVVHGVLHILGHHHSDPDAAAGMEALEQMMLRAHHR